VRMSWESSPLAPDQHFQVVVARREGADWQRVLEQDVGKATNYTYRFAEPGSYSLNLVVLQGPRQVTAQWIGQTSVLPIQATPWAFMMLCLAAVVLAAVLGWRSFRRRYAEGWRIGAWLGAAGSWSRQHVLLYVVLLVSIALRAAVSFSMDAHLTGDAQDYWGNAGQLWYFLRYLALGQVYAAAHFYPYPYYPHGFAFLLAPIYGIFGLNWAVLHILNIIWDTATIIFVFLIGSRLFGPRAGYIGMILMALYPGFINMDYMLFPEQPFTALLMAVIWLIVRCPMEKRGAWRLIGMGALLGVTAVIRPFALPMPAMIFVYLLFVAVQRKVALRRAIRTWAWFTCGAIAAVLPITAANWAKFHEFIPVSNNSGVTIWHGNNPRATGTYNPVFEKENPFGGLPYADANRLGMRLAKDFIVQHPGRFLALAPIKIRHSYADDYNLAGGWPYRSPTGSDRWVVAIWSSPAPHVYHVILVSLWVVGVAWFFVVVARRESTPEAWLIVFMFGYWTAIAVLVFGHAKYAAPLIPLMCVFAAAPLRPRPARPKAPAEKPARVKAS